MPDSCSLCGRVAASDDDRLTWTVEVVGAGRVTRWVCTDCTRENVRAIEAKLDPQWW